MQYIDHPESLNQSGTTNLESNPAMVSDTVKAHRLSTVTTANVTGNTTHELSGIDIATKLHYVRIVYYFAPSEAIRGLTTQMLKDPMFLMLDCFSQVAGRIRRDETGRPHIKCNDSGVRVVEAECEQSIDEWIETKSDWEGELVPDKALGPDLQFSPLFTIQLTRFKCGGLAVGVCWAHVLGDIAVASHCINLWGQFLAGNQAPHKSHRSLGPINKTVSAATGEPRSLKQVEPVRDLWLLQTKHPMVTAKFQITKTKISSHVPAFEAIAALIWQSLAKIRGVDLNTVTIIQNDLSEERNRSLSNNQIISTVATESSPANLAITELALLITEKRKDEKKAIEEMVDRCNGKEDFILYGANLTFVDMEGVDLYGLELKGQKPVHTECGINGVGDEGAVLVLDEARDGRDNGGRAAVVILAEHEIPKLREVLGSEWGIA